MESNLKMSAVPVDSSSSYIFEAPNQTGSPERLLLLAILERAILDYVGNDRKESLASQDWIFSGMEEMEQGEPFTFVWVCSQLDLNPKGVAEMIKAMPKRGSHRIAPWYFTKHYAEKKKLNLSKLN